MARILLLLPGDGIGPEVMAEARRVAEALGLADLVIDEAPFGGAAIDRFGRPLAPEVKERALAADAVLMGAVGGPQWTDQPFDRRPEAGLLELRQAMGVFANLRPARLLPALIDRAPLKAEIVEGLDLLVVRELVGGIYFGEPRGIDRLPSGERVGLNTQRYSEGEIRRVARVAFTLARCRRGRVTSVDKANVMESGRLWRETVDALGRTEFPDVALEHQLADSCAMELVRRPTRFDVILTDNLFGDLLSDLAGQLTGSLGLLPSAALGEAGRPGLYEPIHGSAPDIAGRGIANPCAAVLSLALALRHSLDAPAAADRVERAVERALEKGARTPDLGGSLTTRAMGDAILEELGRA
ncbi:MAG: 3-isopropylmalate dehydrogenase [Sphingomonadaceae bacterium]|uniref:3-isopropylmalate dehydrogenase n=1 Tax=Thermaurantiacus sp. TaxID=2820283 RepID=UPI00298EE3F3|nr:3-isopropylmalate dehydrogenase [Thermaurantiacus sp.]MCS6986069.1 3-isopropylmalate dehydrogenase [Sphingomonadaceae bacterium]MDW8414715.1 3-isopropylmalate dehydrogenase [Thermaurantiacus sp.]